MLADVFRTQTDRLTQSLIAAKFPEYRDLMHLPLLIEPVNGNPYSMHTEEELKDDFDLYCGMIRSQRVTDIYRELIGIEERPDGEVEFVCMTEILSGGTRVVHPFPTYFRMMDTGTDWKIRRIQSSEGHINWTLGRAQITEDGQFDIQSD